MTAAPRPARFVSFEGLDGAGKSTHIARVTELFRAHGYDVVSTREPGGTPLGESLRAILLHEPMSPATEALLMFAARSEHLDLVIKPALTRGAAVVSDRFTDASFAYQGGGRGLSDDRLSILENWVHEGLQPDLTLLFDLPFEVARTRLAGVRKPDRFEQEAEEFHNRVRAAYLRRAEKSGGRIKIIDAAQPLAEISKTVEHLVLVNCLK